MSSGASKRASEQASEGKDLRRRKPVVVRTYRDLLVWQRAMELTDAVYAMTKAMPAEERFGLTLQLRRAVVSIASNIAEGHARQSRNDYLRFLRMARGSIAEVETQIEISLRQKCVHDAQQPLAIARELAIMLQSLIRRLEAKGTDA